MSCNIPASSFIIGQFFTFSSFCAIFIVQYDTRSELKGTVVLLPPNIFWVELKRNESEERRLEVYNL